MIELLMKLAVDSQPQTTPSDFSFLAQNQLDRTRGYAGSTDLMFRATGFSTTTRDAKPKSPMGDADVKIFGWKVVSQ